MFTRRIPPEIRFWEKVALPNENGCMLWLASTVSTGYGCLRIDGRTVLAHRFSYELAHGPIPPGLHIDHLCRTPRCVAPNHLEAVTSGENTRRGESWKTNGLKTECHRGHEFTAANTWVRNGSRFCKECDRIRGEQYRARLRARRSSESTKDSR